MNGNEELIRNIISFAKKMVNNKGKVAVGVVLLLGFTFFNGLYYTVDRDETGIVKRLGRYHVSTEPGFHFKLPFVDEIVKVKTKKVFEEEFGFRTTHEDPLEKASYREDGNESEMLAGDLSVVHVTWVVQYQISNPKDFLFKSVLPTKNLRDVSESVTRGVIGNRDNTTILTVGKGEIEAITQTRIQEKVDYYELGIKIISVKLQEIRPPQEVAKAFDAVNEAKQEQDKRINEAEQKYNKIIPVARGNANKMISEAEGYSTKVVNNAKGEVSRFVEIQKAYKRSPSITKKRIYLETMNEVLKNKEIIVIDKEVKGVLPILNSLGSVTGGSK